MSVLLPLHDIFQSHTLFLFQAPFGFQPHLLEISAPQSIAKQSSKVVLSIQDHPTKPTILGNPDQITEPFRPLPLKEMLDLADSLHFAWNKGLRWKKKKGRSFHTKCLCLKKVGPFWKKRMIELNAVLKSTRINLCYPFWYPHVDPKVWATDSLHNGGETRNVSGHTFGRTDTFPKGENVFPEDKKW